MQQLISNSIAHACLTMTEGDEDKGTSFYTVNRAACYDCNHTIKDVLVKRVQALVNDASVACRGLCLYCLRNGGDKPDLCMEHD